MEKKKYLYEILNYIKEQCEMMMSYVGSETADNVFDEVLYYIRQNYASQLSLENLSEIFGYSSSYLGKLFLQNVPAVLRFIWIRSGLKGKGIAGADESEIYEISAKWDIICRRISPEIPKVSADEPRRVPEANVGGRMIFDKSKILFFYIRNQK